MINIEPPNSPWQELKINKAAGGSLSFYYRDELSKYPVRAVTKVGDNKADPNLETLTYGLFSTCQKDLRSAIVKQGRRFIFFTARHHNARVLVGYYALRWFAPVANTSDHDFAVAADEAHFVSSPLPLSEVDRLCGTSLNRKFRLNLLLSPETCETLKEFLLKSDNAMDAYLAEIHRLERFNKAQGGHLYIGRKLDTEYSWAAAPVYLATHPQDDKASSVSIRNSSPSDWWSCTACDYELRNKALLRICPNCKAINTLVPLDMAPH